MPRVRHKSMLKDSEGASWSCQDGSIELIDYDNAAEWRGDLERKPSLYQWLPINGNTL